MPTGNVNVPNRAWALAGNPGATNQFTLQNLGSDDIWIKSNSSATLPTTMDGAYRVAPGEVLEQRTIAGLWPGSSTHTHLFVNGDAAGRVSISHA